MRALHFKAVDRDSLRNLLESVAAGDAPVDDALRRIESAPFEDLGFAQVDHHRAVREGLPEVVLGLGKTPAQFKVEYDPDGTVARQFDVQAMPTSFLIDRQGKVRVRHAGFKEKNREQREQQIAQLLKEPAA